VGWPDIGEKREKKRKRTEGSILNDVEKKREIEKRFEKQKNEVGHLGI